MRELLEHYGARVNTAGSVAEARAVLQGSEVDVLVTDIRLPDADGYALVRELRASPTDGHLLAVAVTGYGKEEDEARAFEAGFHLQLQKPLEPQAFLAAIAGLRSAATS